MKMVFSRALLVLASTLATIALAKHPFDMRQVDPTIFELKNNVSYRLPNTTHPESYEISLATRIDNETFEFDGNVRIKIVVDQPTRVIVLHARQLTIKQIRLTKYSGNLPINVDLDSHSYEAETEFLKVPTKNMDLLTGDRLTLDITYSGILREDNGGFYRSSYTNSAGKKMYVIKKICVI